MTFKSVDIIQVGFLEELENEQGLDASVGSVKVDSVKESTNKTKLKSNYWTTRKGDTRGNK